MNPRLFIFVSVLALAGCASIPSDLAMQMKHASDKYDSVTKDMPNMTRADLVARLGAPQKEDGAKAIWEVRIDSANYDSLAVEFDRDGRVTKMTKAHGRGSPSPSWNSMSLYSHDK